MAKFNPNTYKRQIKDAQRKAEQQVRREIDKAARAVKVAVDEHNRKAVTRYRQVVNTFDTQSRQRKSQIIADLRRQLRLSNSPIRYNQSERQLADRVYEAVSSIGAREYDTFMSYARIDGSNLATELRDELMRLGVSVWHDEVSIVPGRSQALQMDAGLMKARSGIAVLTPAYLTGRFWTERELGALLGKAVLIPVLHNVTFEDVREYSGILPDLAGFTTENDSIETIAQKIAAAVVPSAD